MVCVRKAIPSMLAYMAIAQQDFNTLAKCQEVANLFDNTCSDTTTPIDFSTHAGSSMTCTGENLCPNGSGTSTPCTWTRKLCVTCSESGGATYIRV